MVTGLMGRWQGAAECFCGARGIGHFGAYLAGGRRRRFGHALIGDWNPTASEFVGVRFS